VLEREELVGCRVVGLGQRRGVEHVRMHMAMARAHVAVHGAVHLDHLSRSGSLVQAIDVLRDGHERELLVTVGVRAPVALESRESTMAVVGLRSCDRVAEVLQVHLPRRAGHQPPSERSAEHGQSDSIGPTAVGVVRC